VNIGARELPQRPLETIHLGSYHRTSISATSASGEHPARGWHADASGIAQNPKIKSGYAIIKTELTRVSQTNDAADKQVLRPPINQSFNVVCIYTSKG
jgi:hypothetical protein